MAHLLLDSLTEGQMRECDGRSCWKSCLTRPTAFPARALVSFRKAKDRNDLRDCQT
ncbi:MAG: hypothetical protein ACI85J_000183 [Candidatus Poriferisodalaceae bacterium]